MKFKFKFIILFALLTCFFVGGVSATWVFAEERLSPTQDNQGLNINEWYYEENVPGGGDHKEEDFDHGISHAGLIQDIIDDISLYHNNEDSMIMGAIEGAIEAEQKNGSQFDHNGVGSSTKYNGVTLRNFAGSLGYENLGFFIYYGPDVTDASEITYIEIYTYTLSDTSRRVGEYIEVYKTIAEYVGENWVLRGGWKGLAPIVVYGSSNTTGKYKNVIDPSKWVQAS